MTRHPAERYDGRSRERAADGVVHAVDISRQSTRCGLTLETTDWVPLVAAVIDCPGCVQQGGLHPALR